MKNSSSSTSYDRVLPAQATRINQPLFFQWLIQINAFVDLSHRQTYIHAGQLNLRIA